MMETAIVCTFCNSRIDRLIDRTKTLCPRCDAALPASIVEKLGTATGPPNKPVEMPASPGRNKTVAAILGVMALMAIVTVGFTL